MAPAEAPAGLLAIEVVVGVAPRRLVRIALRLPAGSTVREALDAAKVGDVVDALRPDAIASTLESGAWTVGIWGRRERLGQVLRDQDRIELVRPLIVDPKEARRVRFKAHAEKVPGGLQRGKAR
jgi:putative ubiquitin-RnfH superfamily antitoxin RatB of RatAB toxin-antitoxin module